MALTLKDSNQASGAGTPGAPTQQTQSKTNSTSRANPVCLDVGVTIRGLPGDSGGLPHTFREEVRTVIVFDNGAVLRSANNLPSGLKIILTNPKGRDVVCKVAEGRNIPAVKGYVEVEFTEPVMDFWQIHQGVGPAAAAPPLPSAPAPTEAPKQHTSSTPETSRPAEPPRENPTPASQSSGGAPSFEDIAGVVRMTPSSGKRESRLDPAKPAAKTSGNGETTHVIAETSRTAFAPSRLPGLEPSRNESVQRAASGLSPIAPRTQSQAADFMSMGLLTSAPLESSSRTRPRRTPLILAALLSLSAVGVGVYIWRGGVIPLPALNGLFGRGGSSSAPETAIPASERVQTVQQAESPMPISSRPVAEESSQQPSAPARPLEPKMTAAEDEGRTDRQQVKNHVAIKQTEPAPSRPPAFSNLKLKSPTSPGRTLANLGQEAAPPSEIASAGNANAAPPSGLMATGSRPAAPSAPAPAFPAATTAPPSAVPAAATAPRPKVATEPKLISSTRPVYPPAARESNIQGSVVLHASVDEKGNVVAVNVVSGPVFLRQAALDSVKQWKYSPATLDGKPASSEVAVSVEFRLK